MKLLKVKMTLSNSGVFAEYLAYLLMALFQLLLFCWPGDWLINYSFMIHSVMYSANWYKAGNSAFRTAITFVILRAQKPCCLTAGKFHNMSFGSFTTILNTSFSYFMLLKRFESDEKSR